MDYIYPVVIAGTTFMLPAYMYLYMLDRERYMGIWFVGWFLFFIRFVCFDYGPFNWKEPLLEFTVFHALMIGSSLIFLWGTHIFIDKPVNKYWLYCAVSAALLSSIFAFFDSPFTYKMLFASGFCGITFMQIGRLFVHQVKIKGIGNYITGWAFTLWGLLTIMMPYSFSVLWIIPWYYFMGGILRFMITAGMLLLYFEKTREDLLHKEAQYRLLAENAVDIIYRYRLLPSPKFEYISPYVLAVTGYCSEEFYTDSELLTKLVHPDDTPIFTNFTKPDVHRDLPLSFRLIRKDGNIIWIEQKSVSIHDQAGNSVVVEGILRDVTARKNMEELVFKVEKMNLVGQMAVSVAHEIRNPLTSVRGYLQLMSIKERDSAGKERYELMISELDRANKIITEYLLLAKDKVPDLKRRCLNRFIDTLIPLLKAAAADSNVDIRLSLGNIPELYLDENEIRQLLFNLVNNGLDAMPTGGELVIRTFVEEDCAVLAVSDQGSGIPKHILNTLGTPFLTTKDSGNGLGLPICYRIVNRHNATLKVETSDHGTTFFVRFKIAEFAA